MRLLSVDWDYFCPTKEVDPKEWQLYDWGHNENWPASLQEFLWVERAAGFDRFGIDLPCTSGEEKTFWSRFKFAPGAQLFLADSHCHAASEEVLQGVDEVWNFDAHHDMGYSETPLAKPFESGQVDCSDWMLAYWLRSLKTKFFVRYPRWKHWAMDEEFYVPDIVTVDRTIDDGEAVDLYFGKVFIARSGSWTPPWLDEFFQVFVESCPIYHGTTTLGETNPLILDTFETVRGFDYEAVEEAKRLVEEARKSWETQSSGLEQDAK